LFRLGGGKKKKTEKGKDGAPKLVSKSVAAVGRDTPVARLEKKEKKGKGPAKAGEFGPGGRKRTIEKGTEPTRVRKEGPFCPGRGRGGPPVKEGRGSPPGWEKDHIFFPPARRKKCIYRWKERERGESTDGTKLEKKKQCPT